MLKNLIHDKFILVVNFIIGKIATGLIVFGNPINFVDPLGLCGERVHSRYDFLRDVSNFAAGFGGSYTEDYTKDLTNKYLNISLRA